MTPDPVLSPEEQSFLEQHFRAQYEKMFRTASIALGDESLAEVAVQETFVAAIRKYDEFRSSPNPTGWLFNGLKLSIKHLRRDRKLVAAHCIALEDAPELSVSMSPVDMLEVDSNAELRLLRRLYVEGYSVKELAAELDISVPALKMRISRAKKRLQNNAKIKNLKNVK